MLWPFKEWKACRNGSLPQGCLASILTSNHAKHNWYGLVCVYCRRGNQGSKVNGRELVVPEHQSCPRPPHRLCSVVACGSSPCCPVEVLRVEDAVIGSQDMAYPMSPGSTCHYANSLVPQPHTTSKDETPLCHLPKRPPLPMDSEIGWPPSSVLSWKYPGLDLFLCRNKFITLSTVHQ